MHSNSKRGFLAFIRTLSLTAAFGLIPTVSADTAISGRVMVNEPNAYFGAAGTITMPSGATLDTRPNNQGAYTIANAFVFSGSGGTVNLHLNDNGTTFTFTGPFTSTATGAQTLDIHTGIGNNGDREEVTFTHGIPNVGDGSPLALAVKFNTQTLATGYVNLAGDNTFTGNITLIQGNASPRGYLTIGGRGKSAGGNNYVSVPGSGTLAKGNYAGDVALGTATTLVYASSATQTLSGTISGVGALQVDGSGPLTLSGTNTYSGNTTVNSGAALVLGSDGGLKFTVENILANKITGKGSANLNGTFTLDTAAVSVISGSWTLVDIATKSFGEHFKLLGFAGPSDNVYTKTVKDQTWTFNKSSGVLKLSTAAAITSFGVPGLDGVIDQVTKTIALTVPYGTPLATLAPTFTVTSGTCNPPSAKPPSPTFAASNPATYSVTDGTVTTHYKVTIHVTPASTAKDILSFNLADNPGFVSANTIYLIVPVGTNVSHLAPTYTLSQFAAGSPLSGTARNFKTPQTYTITAQDSSTKTYTVIVENYASWSHSASMFILTTPEGANLADGASETNFPLLVRLNGSNFDFSHVQPDGRDLRFATADGAGLFYQIEQWDPAHSTASIWVKIPTITGNARQKILMYWGRADATAESSGTGVFNAANGYVSVLHMNETVKDDVGSVNPHDTGTTLTHGIIGKGRHFDTGKGINCGEDLTTLPSGNVPHSTQAWFRTATSNGEIVGWGADKGGKSVRIRLMDSGGPSLNGANVLSPEQWYQVVHTYTDGASKIYIDGQLDASAAAKMDMAEQSKMWIGGWNNRYDYAGDIDEVRLSKVARSANWIKLEYENQKALQTLVGNPVQAGSTFSVTPSAVTQNEGATTLLTAKAGGAQKVYWIEKKHGVESVVATDQFTFKVNPGRVTGNQSYAVQLKAIYPTEIKTIDVPVTITEAIPDPLFTLSGPTRWDGRQTIAITAKVSNLAALPAKGVANLKESWHVKGVAVAKTIEPGVLTLTRSQGSGPMTVTLVIDNGGTPVTASKTITVQEPASDAWVQRTPDANEKPVDNQFFARDPDTNKGTIYYNGTQSGSPDKVYLKVFTTDTGSDVPYAATHRQPLVGDAYAFSVPIAAGKVTYKVVYGTTTGGVDTDVATVSNLICGDAYVIEGQSNALATDNAEQGVPAPSPWIRSYGQKLGWGNAVNKGTELQLGVWGIILAQRLLADNNMPICIINGAVGGTRIDEHQPNPAGHGIPSSLYAIYANLYNRLVEAKLTHGIRSVMWHQGEADQGAGGPGGGYNYKFYQQYFVDMTAAWKTDFPNIQNYYVFQIWPAACGDGSRNDELREVQRTLSDLYSNMRMMSTLGIEPGSSCHYVLAGYQKFSDLMAPLIEQDAYSLFKSSVFTAANLKKAHFTTAAKNEIALEFDQDMAWNPGAPGLLFLDGVAGKVASGSATGKVIKLQLSEASAAKTITYLIGKNQWIQGDLIYGKNGIAALTFCEVPIKN